MIMKDQDKKIKKETKKGPVIPAGTEQETGLTRGKTEKPGVLKPRPPRKPDDEVNEK
jgi:hypothetical protein